LSDLQISFINRIFYSNLKIVFSTLLNSDDFKTENWQNGQKMISKFDEMKINYKYSEYPGGQTWPVWRNNLYNFAQLLFKN